MKTLPPQPLKDAYWAEIETQLKRMLYEIAFVPVMEVLRAATVQRADLPELHNAGGNLTPLLVALRQGRIQYAHGEFTGDFNLALAKDLKAIGARWDVRRQMYRMEVGLVPEFIRAEAARYQSIAEEAHAEMKRRLDDVQKRLAATVDSKSVKADGVLQKIDQDWRKGARLLDVKPELTKAAKEALAEDYNKNMRLSIKEFSSQSIGQLRDLVEANALTGYRFDKLIAQIRHRYGVTANKARFLARQETSLFMSKFRKQRFEQAGVRRYRWSTAHDERVRDSHRHLNGRVFSYDDPPITDRRTGARNNPGEDFNCRCVDEALLEYDPTGPDRGKIMVGVG